MTIDEIKRGLECCADNHPCRLCPYVTCDDCWENLKTDAFECIESLERLSTPETGRSIDAVEFLSRLHEWQAHAVINELTESKAVFDISIAIVEDLVKELRE